LEITKAFKITQRGVAGNDALERCRDADCFRRHTCASILHAIMDYTTLVTAAALAGNVDNLGWVLFDCRHELANPEFGPKAYAESHIPNARFAHVDRDLSAPLTGSNGRHPLPDARRFGDWLGRMGVESSKQVIAYDHAGGGYAARLWWMLRWLGHDRVAVLDGGWDAWVNAGYPVPREIPQPIPAHFALRPRDAWVDARSVLAHLDRPDMLLVDARSSERFHGRNETIDPVGGHIPGARNRFFKDNLDPLGRFKPAAQLREEFLQVLGTARPVTVVHQCGSGVSACHNLLAMEIAGLSGSKLYPGSWSEWIADRSRPIAT
jgi:thiosulfate/3-mercaptopyruvate sulfurtransferase